MQRPTYSHAGYGRSAQMRERRSASRKAYAITAGRRHASIQQASAGRRWVVIHADAYLYMRLACLSDQGLRFITVSQIPVAVVLALGYIQRACKRVSKTTASQLINVRRSGLYPGLSRLVMHLVMRLVKSREQLRDLSQTVHAPEPCISRRAPAESRAILNANRDLC